MYFIGIDPGKKDLKTTGICILEEKGNRIRILTKTVYGRNTIRVLSKYLKETKTIAIEAPISYGQGKGKMRLWEKYFSQKSFLKRQISPLPPAFMGSVIENSMSMVGFFQKRGFAVNKTIIETFHPLLIKVIKKGRLPKVKYKFKSSHEYHAFYCSYISYLHFKNETFWIGRAERWRSLASPTSAGRRQAWIGHSDEKVFLPKPKFWYKKEWRWFSKTWHKKHPFRYKYLESNLSELQSGYVASVINR